MSRRNHLAPMIGPALVMEMQTLSLDDLLGYAEGSRPTSSRLFKKLYEDASKAEMNRLIEAGVL